MATANILNHKALFVFISLVFSLIINDANAACVALGNASVAFSLPPNISVPRDAPIGEPIFYTTPQALTSSSGARCDNIDSMGLINNIGSQPSSSTINAVFPTGVTGLGYRIKILKGGRQEYAVPFGGYITTVGDNMLDGTSYFFEFFKSGPLPSGSRILAGKLATYKYGEAEVANFFLNNSVTFTDSTCVTPNVLVFMGSQKISGFSGVNSSLSPVPFTINLACSQGFNSIKYRLDPTTAIINQAGSVIALDSNSSASGIGVQILDSLGKPLPLGVDMLFSNNANAGGNFSIPLKAAYYKIANAVKAGTANTSLTFTMNYQ